MTVQAFPLSHVNPYESTAFLIKKDNNAILYLGDTGPDSVEKPQTLPTFGKPSRHWFKSKSWKVFW